MTMPTTRLQIPDAGFPMVTRVISNPIFPPDRQIPAQLQEPVTWVVGQVHPFVTTMRIVRMFIVPDGVAIYSSAEGSDQGMRNLVPMQTVRFTEEVMPAHIFVEELEAAEAGDDPDEPQGPENGEGAPFPGDADGTSALT